MGGTSAEAVLAMAAQADGGSFDDLPEERDDDGGRVRGVRHGGFLPIGAYVGHPTAQQARIRIAEGRVELTSEGGTTWLLGPP